MPLDQSIYSMVSTGNTTKKLDWRTYNKLYTENLNKEFNSKMQNIEDFKELESDGSDDSQKFSRLSQSFRKANTKNQIIEYGIYT